MKAQPIADDTLMLAMMVAEGFEIVSKLNENPFSISKWVV